MPKKDKSTPTPAAEKIEKFRGEHMSAEDAYKTAKKAFKDLLPKTIGMDPVESERLKNEASAKVEIAKMTMDGWAEQILEVEALKREEDAKIRAENAVEIWRDIERDGLELLNLAKKADEHLDAALNIFWECMDRGLKLYRATPATDGTAAVDAPIGNMEMQAYFRKHLRKRGLMFAWEWFQDDVEPLPTFSVGVQSGLRWLHKKNPNNPYPQKSVEEKPTTPAIEHWADTGVSAASRPKKPRVSMLPAPEQGAE